ncbi:MAG TPA: acyl-CoA dehydrogenase, partial [Sphingomicrobium sp.]|nr:acyl-CoA dehydrogenase [Sphingomicrobium sp.]
LGQHRLALHVEANVMLVGHADAAVHLHPFLDVANLAVKEGVQMHGGIGMTDEHDIGLYMKREAVLSELLGDIYHHRNRVAELSGY